MHELLETQLHKVTHEHLPVLLPLISAYHSFEDIDLSDQERKKAIEILINNKHLGCVWLISSRQLYVGYIVLGFGYSVEFTGRDAFVDEFFISEPYRSKGIGSQALYQVQDMLPDLGIHALHLEVARNNPQARSLYEKLNFKAREKFVIMSYKAISQ